MRPKHLVIPDRQEKPGRPSAMEWIANYCLEKRPDVIVDLGDAWDMASLSSYESDRRKVAEARDVLEDIQAGNAAFEVFNRVIRDYNRQRPARRRYKPRRVYLKGNHDADDNGGRVARAIEAQPWLAGFFRLHPLDPGREWEVVPFLQPKVIDGIAYCHYFCRGPNGGVVNARRGAPSAKAMIQREARSCTAGHKQGLETHVLQVGGGRRLRGVIAGSCYLGEEDYLTPQGTGYWRGILVKHEVHDGDYDLMEVSLDYLKRRYS